MKKVLSFVLVIVMLCSSFAGLQITSQAADLPSSGKCGTNVTYTFDSGTLRINGTGAMYDYYYGSPFANSLKIQTVYIDDGVTGIGALAFVNCSYLRRVELPETLTHINPGAFQRCTSLKEVSIPKNVISIGRCAFDVCAKVEKYKVDKNNTHYCSEDGVLFDIDKTVLIQYPIGNERKSYTVPNSVEKIAASAFNGSYAYTVYYSGSIDGTSLEEIILPDNLKEIEEIAFANCQRLESITLPESLSIIGERAFHGCVSLSEINIEKNVTFIDDSAFSDCKSLKRITVSPDNTKYTDLDGVLFNKSMTKLIHYPGNNGVLSYVIPDGVKTIASYSFDNAKKLECITIPNSVTAIHSYAFDKSAGLKDVYYMGDEQAWKTISIYQNNNYLKNANLHYIETINKTVEGVLRKTNDWSIIWKIDYYETLTGNRFNPQLTIYIEGSNVEDGSLFLHSELGNGFEMPWLLEEYGFSKKDFTSITITGSRVNPFEIISSQFCEYTNVRTLQLTFVKSIQSKAFENCTNLRSVHYDAYLETIGDNAFSNNHALTTVSSNESFTALIKTIGNAAFQNTSLSSISLMHCETIGKFAFQNTALSELYLSRTTKSIGANAFLGCSKLCISCFKNSCAHTHALSNNIDFILVDENAKIDCIDQTIDLFDVIGDCSFEDYVKSLDSTLYSPKLSYMLAGLSRAAYSEECVEKSLQSLGFKEKDKDYKIYNTGADFTAGHSIAKKQLSDGSTLVLITIRGSYDVTDWINNLDFSTVSFMKGYHSGFHWSKERVYDHLKEFLGDIPKSNVRYVITGHSLGGAVGNLLAVKLSDEGVQKEKVFNYNFACPDVARGNDMEWNPGGVHDNIFNLGSAKDYVSVLPGITLNSGNVLFPWGKFGRSYWFSKNWGNLDEIIIDWSFDAHDAKHYVDYMERQNDLSSFKSWGEVKLARTGAYGSTILHCFFCPVDVTVYDKSGKTVAAVKDNKAYYYDSKYGSVMIFVEGDKKYISLPADKEYDIRMTGTDEGEMTYTAIQQNAQTSDNITFEHIALTSGKQMQTTSGKKELTDAKLYVLDEKQNAVAEVEENGTEKPHVHEFKAVKTASTTTAVGYTRYKCTNCGEYKKDSKGNVIKDKYTAPTSKISGLKLKSRNDSSITVTWNKVSGVSGYQIQTCTKDGKKWSTYATLGAGTNTYTFKKLASGNNYKFRCRFFIKGPDGKTYNSPWCGTVNAPTLPKGMTLSKLTAAKKAFTAQWKKQSGVTGYQVQYYTSSKFTSPKIITVKNVKTLKATAKNLSAKKTYYVRVRTYKTINKANYCSTWSKTYKVKTK